MLLNDLNPRRPHFFSFSFKRTVYLFISESYALCLWALEFTQRQETELVLLSNTHFSVSIAFPQKQYQEKTLLFFSSLSSLIPTSFSLPSLPPTLLSPSLSSLWADSQLTMFVMVTGSEATGPATCTSWLSGNAWQRCACAMFARSLARACALVCMWAHRQGQGARSCQPGLGSSTLQCCLLLLSFTLW